LVCALRFVVVPLRLVGEELENHETNHGAAEQGVVGCDFVALEAVRKEEDIRGRGDEPEKNLP
jgi:hypothetical protein